MTTALPTDAAPPELTGPPARWNNRIIGYGEEAPEQLLSNPRNWRLHPQQQQDALASVLDTVGWVTPVIVNRRTAFVVDGHLRVALALRREEPRLPVLYVDLTEDEEALVLATVDPITAMAVTDRTLLGDLLNDLTHTTAVESVGLSTLLADIARQEKAVLVAPADGMPPPRLTTSLTRLGGQVCPSCGYQWQQGQGEGRE